MNRSDTRSSIHHLPFTIHQVDNSAFNAKVFVAPPQAVAMEFYLFGESGLVIELRVAGVSKG